MAEVTSVAGVDDGTGPGIDQAGERRSARIESMRALAALGVLVSHVYGWSHGWAPEIYGSYHARLLVSGGFGVNLFFALSGYLLYLPFARSAYVARASVDLGRYARNRALRVLPLYYVVVTTYLLLDNDGLRSQWWRFAVFGESLSGRTVARMDGPVWSLVVEVQFYILLPLFAWLVARLARGRLALAVALVTAVGGGLLALRVATVTTAGTVDPVWRYSLPATAVFFVPGLLLALGHVAIDRRPRAWTRRAWVGDSSMWLLAGAALWLVVAHRYTWDALLLPASALLVGACALPLRPGALVRVLDVRMVAAVGAASYSLYLWHEPVVHALANAGWVPAGFVPLLVASVLLCVAVAVSSYAVVEAPFLRLRRSWSAARAARLDVDGGGALGRSWQTALHSFVVRSRWIPLPTRPPQ